MSAGGQLDQVGVEAVQRVQGQDGAGGVVALVGEQFADVFQAFQVSGAPAGGGGFGLSKERDLRAGCLRALMRRPGR